jgi:hypothetical protein
VRRKFRNGTWHKLILIIFLIDKNLALEMIEKSN